MELRVEISGEVVEREELLNGTETVTLEGSSTEGEWTFAGALSWNVGLVNYAGEGDLTLTRRDGAEIFGTLTRLSVTEPTAGDAEGGSAFHAVYEIDGGSGAFDGATGGALAAGTLRGDAFAGEWTVQLSTA
jgi:hypothetical protein